MEPLAIINSASNIKCEISTETDWQKCYFLCQKYDKTKIIHKASSNIVETVIERYNERNKYNDTDYSETIERINVKALQEHVIPILQMITNFTNCNHIQRLKKRY